MYQVHLEWQTRVCPVGVASLTRQFRRYFDRFEGRIREPPFAVFDDLAYTQGTPVSKLNSPSVERGDIGNVVGMTTGPNLDEYRERLRGFAMDLGKDDDVMSGIFNISERNADLAELYTFPPPLSIPSIKTEGPHPASTTSAQSFSNTIDGNLFSGLDPFTPPMGKAQSFEPSPSGAILSPFELASIHSTSSHHSAGLPGRLASEELGEFLYDGEDLGVEQMDDLFGDMPDMPGLDGIIDPAFLEFLDGAQP
jgi:hypothetical protein